MYNYHLMRVLFPVILETNTKQWKHWTWLPS